MKGDTPFVRFPREVLDGMLLVRVHLDPVGEQDGPLEVIPGSHRDDAGASPGDRPARRILAERGDVLVMRPRVLHRSARHAGRSESTRRVVQCVVAPGPVLPAGYEWHDYRRFAQSVDREKMMAEALAVALEKSTPRARRIRNRAWTIVDIAEQLLSGREVPLTGDDIRAVRADLRELMTACDYDRLEAMERWTAALHERMERLVRKAGK